MFATLLGALPTPDMDEGGDPIQTEARAGREGPGGDHDLVAGAVRAQVAAGLEPITDGRLPDPGFDGLTAAISADSLRDSSSIVELVVDRWRYTAGLTDRAVKHALPGPYTLGRRLARDDARASEKARLLMGSARAQSRSAAAGWATDGPRRREPRTLRFAERLREIVDALAAAGCPLVEIEELDPHLIGEDEGERRLFREAHRRLAEGVKGTHLSLSIAGPSAASGGAATILDAPYASYAFDLIAGPDNWHLVRAVPGYRGVIAGVLSGGNADEPREVMLWAAHYAASSGSRGRARVGLGSAGSYADLTWDSAVRKMRRLGEVARLAEQRPGDELARSLDPRAVSSRRAALGHDAPRPARRRR